MPLLTILTVLTILKTGLTVSRDVLTVSVVIVLDLVREGMLLHLHLNQDVVLNHG